jgi:hypothetical protein
MIVHGVVNTGIQEGYLVEVHNTPEHQPVLHVGVRVGGGVIGVNVTTP